jgi:hypothetical protein
MKGSEEMDIAAVIAGGDAAKMFEPVEAALDAVTEPIGFDVMTNDGAARAFGRNHGFGAEVGDEAAKAVAVVAPVSDDPTRSLPFEEGRCLREIVCLTGRENEAQRSAECVGKKVDFGGQSTSRTPQSLIFGPPFPVAACWWARTKLVSSMRYSLRRSLVSTTKTRSQTPALAQREKRVCTLFHLPYRSGRSLQRAPERSTHNTPSTNRRLSLAVRPRSPALPGRRASIRAHCASVSSYRLAIRAPRIKLNRDARNHQISQVGILNVDWT